MKPQVYVDSRPAEYFTKFHERVRSRRPDWVYRVARIVLTPSIMVGYRFRAIGVENVPLHGPVILAPNHFSFFDHFFAGVFIPREVQFMAKSQLFRPPFLNFILSHGGTFPVRRGQHDEEAFITAHSVLDQGGLLLVYAEGGRSRSGKLGQPKPGLGRLALESGVPIVPVAIHGSEHARDAKKLWLPKVTLQYDRPITFEPVEHPGREQCQRASEQVFERVREMHEALCADGRSGVLSALRRRAPVSS